MEYDYALTNLTLEYFIKCSLEEAERYIQSLDEGESRGGMSQHEIDAQLIHHMSYYISNRVDQMRVADALSLFELLKTDIMLDTDPSASSTDRIVLLKLYLVKRVEFELALQYA